MEMKTSAFMGKYISEMERDETATDDASTYSYQSPHYCKKVLVSLAIFLPLDSADNFSLQANVKHTK